MTTVNLENPAEVIQRVRLEQYRDNVDGALRLLRQAHDAWPNPEYTILAQRITAALKHLDTRAAYADAYERFYWTKKGRLTLKHLERDLRILLGIKTRKTVRRLRTYPEFELLEREVVGLKAQRVLDAGCGEGRVALALAARHPALILDAIEVSPTNLRLAQRMNRFANATFHLGFLEDAPQRFAAAAFDVAYAFGVLEHVANVDLAVKGIMEVLRPGGRFCFVVPMNEFTVTGPLPEPSYEDGVAGHVRVFTEDDLRAQFEQYDHFRLVKLPGKLPNKYPDTLVPVEFGAFFVVVAKPVDH